MTSRYSIAFVAALMVVSFTISLTPSIEAHRPEDVDPVTLGTGSVFPKGFLETHGYELLENELLEDRTAGKIKFNYRGGPSTFPPTQCFHAVSTGALDICNTAPYYDDVLPVAKVINMPEQSPWKLREMGIFEVWDQFYKPQGVKYLGRAESGVKFHCYTKDKISSPEGLEGMNIRVSPTYRPLLNRFGANPVQTPPSEVYTALDRGVVDGFCWPGAGMVVEQGWDKLVNYVIDPGFYQVVVHLLMNLDKWNSLSPTQQESLMDAVQVMERQTHYYFGMRAVQDRKKMLNRGLEVIEFKGETRQKWLRAAYSSYWQMLLDQSEQDDIIRKVNRMLEEAGQKTYFPE